jgi:phage head maturation protease
MSVNVQEIDLETAQFKASALVQTGLRQLEFYAAAFSATPDANGDIIDAHAFDEWLAEFYAAGKPLPISFSHSAVLDSLDPTNVIGYAPADPQHVWVDGYGLRVSSLIDVTTEKGKAVEWQIENKLMGGASIAYVVPDGGRTKVKGWNLVSKAFVKEAGPTPNPANQEAVLLWLKSEHLIEESPEQPYMTVDEFRETFLKMKPGGAVVNVASIHADETTPNVCSYACTSMSEAALLAE